MPKPEEKYAKLVYVAENNAKLGIFDGAYSKYLQAAESAYSLGRTDESRMWKFLAAIYKCNESIDNQDQLLSGLYSIIESYRTNPVDKVTVYMPGGIFGEYPAKRFVNEAIGLLALYNAEHTNMGLNETIENLDKAIEALMEIGNDYLFYSKYLDFIGKRVTANYAALMTEAKKEYLLGDYYSDEDPTVAVEHYMISARGFRTARRMDLYKKTIKLIQGVRVSKKCWFCGREIQGEKHFYYVDANIGRYFHKLLEKNQDRHAIQNNKVVVCSVCYSAIEEISKIYAQRILLERIERLESTVGYLKRKIEAFNVYADRNTFGGGY